LVRTFVDQLTAEQVSNFLAWYLFFDLVKLPESPSRWYGHIYSMQMKGWIALGKFLNSGVDYGLDLVPLHSICDRLRLNKRVVHTSLVRVADPEKMTWTNVAAVFKDCEEEHMTEVETLEEVQGTLSQLRALAAQLKPTPNSQFEDFRNKSLEQAQEFLDRVVHPRISALRANADEPNGVWDTKTREMMFYFEALREPRKVPLIRYGIYPDSLMEESIKSLSSGSSKNSAESSPMERVFDNESEIERSFSAATLKEEIRLLRHRIATVEDENKQIANEKELLAAANQKLEKRLARVARYASELMSEDSDSGRPPVIPSPDIGDVFRGLQLDSPKEPTGQPTPTNSGPATPSSVPSALRTSLSEPPSSSPLAGKSSKTSLEPESQRHVIFADPASHMPVPLGTHPVGISVPTLQSPIPPPAPGQVPHVSTFNHALSKARAKASRSKSTPDGSDQLEQGESSGSAIFPPVVGETWNAVRRKVGRKADADDSDADSIESTPPKRSPSFSGGYKMLPRTRLWQNKDKGKGKEAPDPSTNF
jgi:hypothetical protein